MIKCWLCPHCLKVYIPTTADLSGRCPECGAYESSARVIRSFSENELRKMKKIESAKSRGYQAP